MPYGEPFWAGGNALRVDKVVNVVGVGLLVGLIVAAYRCICSIYWVSYTNFVSGFYLILAVYALYIRVSYTCVK